MGCRLRQVKQKHNGHFTYISLQGLSSVSSPEVSSSASDILRTLAVLFLAIRVGHNVDCASGREEVLEEVGVASCSGVNSSRVNNVSGMERRKNDECGSERYKPFVFSRVV